jgi:hypothetical protein
LWRRHGVGIGDDILEEARMTFIVGDRLRRAILFLTIAVISLIIGGGIAQAQPAAMFADPDFSDSAGDWDIEGVVLGTGNTFVCKMQKAAEDGSAFTYVIMISAGSNELNLVDAYLTPSALPEDSSPKVAIFFDGKKATELTGGVKKGILHADLAKLSPSAMGHITELFRTSKTLAQVASLKGHPSEKITVDLADGDTAFDKRGQCSKAMLDIGMERMKNGK